MNEFVTVSTSSYDPASLATKLNEKSAQGWTVVAIVPTGGDVTAFLSRPAGSASAEPAAAAAVAVVAVVAAEPAPVAPEPVAEPVVEPVAATVTEPAGWAAAPEETVVAPVAAAPTPAVTTAAVTTAAVTAPAVPAGWYADPAGRFELRYWDGVAWTEHVSRAGQQYTDPPVA